jgi:hypothetical protein
MDVAMRRMLVVPALLTALAAPARAQDVVVQLEQALERVENTIEQSFSRALPLPAPSAGVAYSFDPATGNFRREPSTFGQVYLERADPLGAGHFNVSFLFQYVSLDSVDGQDADALRTRYPIPVPDFLAAVDLPTLSAAADVQQFLFSFSYGVSDALEASLAVPLVYSHVAVDAPVSGAAVTSDGQLVLIDERIVDSTDTFGVGDVFLRGKYRFAELDAVHLSAGLLLRLPSGDPDELRGIGYVEVTPSLLASTRVFDAAPWARLQGHANAAIGIDTEDVGSSEARWGFGLDWGLTENLTAGIAFLAQNQFARVAPSGTFTFPRCESDLVTCAVDPSVRIGTQQLYGLSDERPDYYTFAIGGRSAVWRDTLFAFANLAVPLNDGFVGFAPIPVVGVEGTF